MCSVWRCAVALAVVGFPADAEAAGIDLSRDRMTYPKALCGRLEPRQDLPDWMRVPRWCTTDAPRWERGKTAEPIEGFADWHANVLRLGMSRPRWARGQTYALDL